MRSYNFCKHTWYAAKHFLLIAVLCLPFDSHAIDSDPGKADSSEISISSSGDGYALFAQQAKLSDILHELGAAADFELKLFETLDEEKADWKYEAMDLIQLLDNLLRDYNTLMLYEETQDKAQGNTGRKLKELWLIASDDSNTPAPPVTRNIEIELEQPEPATNKQQALTAEQQYEIKHIDNLEGLSGEDVIESLKQTLLTEQDPVIRKRAVSALGKIGGTQVLDALESGLADNSGEVRSELARSFARIQDQRSVLALGQMSVGDQDVKVRQQAIRGLAQQENPAARAFIEAALSDESKSVQEAARDYLH